MKNLISIQQLRELQIVMNWEKKIDTDILEIDWKLNTYHARINHLRHSLNIERIASNTITQIEIMASDTDDSFDERETKTWYADSHTTVVDLLKLSKDASNLRECNVPAESFSNR